ncbi:MAG: sulfurtransferase-like selenium metabolism protein YedF [Atopobiaceae bacterium]|jgi:selenium metabolism protein YedF
MQIDARDLFNPKPVVMALTALGELKPGETLAVLVNDGKAVESLVRLADEQKCKFIREDEGDYTVVTLQPSHAVKTANPIEKAVSYMDFASADAPIIVFGSEAIGRGDKSLGHILMREIIFDLAHQEVVPKTIVFINSGVKLTIKGSAVIEDLQILADLGTEILSDTVSLDRYGATDELLVGEPIDPYNLARILMGQPGVVSL